MANFRRIVALIAVLALCRTLPAQTDAAADSIVRLLSAEKAQLITENGMNFRRVQGNAKFLHNDTYLLCDSASWNVDAQYIDCFGNVKVIQDRTMLTSEQLLYLIDENTAKFKGPLVELTDKDGNCLRTNNLDYNTKDSVATFLYGGALKNESGNVIESRRGIYDSKIKLFTFEDNVELYMDSIPIKTETLRYFTDIDRAVFGGRTYVWQNDGFVKADGGWYSRRDSLLHFSDNVYMNDPDYEVWAEEVYYHQLTQNVEMFHNVSILDTADKSVFFAHKAEYVRDSSRAKLSNLPAIIYYGENENNEVDTLFVRADTLEVYSMLRDSIGKDEITEAQKRRADMLFDSLEETRIKQAEERHKAWLEKMRQAGKLPPEGAGQDSTAADGAIQDSTAAVGAALDSTAAVGAALDSTATEDLPEEMDTTALPAAPADSLAAPPTDTVKIKFVKGYHNFKMYRSDIQAACDSVIFCELDSIARMFGRPVLWNAVKNQLTSETMQLLMRDGNVERGSMVTDARVTSKEDSIHFNQIKSTEMIGFFKENQIYRYDALGGVTAIFYMTENEHLTTINIKEAKSLTAVIKDGNARKMLYMETVKSDAYPIGELAVDKQRLKGFEWRGEERPVNRFAITNRMIPVSERAKYIGVIKPEYRLTDRYFDNYMMKIEAAKAAAKEAERRRLIEQAVEELRIEDSIARAAALLPVEDTLEITLYEDSIAVDSVAVDSLAVDSVAVADMAAPSDTAVATVTTAEAAHPASVKPILKSVESVSDAEDLPAVNKERVLTSKEKRAIRKAQRIAKREARRAAREARRAERIARRLQRRSGR